MKTIHTDCLVLGAGLAGSAYALHAARAGLKVELLSLGDPLQANSDWAQGGIIYDTSPDPAQLARDILEASDHTANPAAIDQLVREGPVAVKELLLDELHVGFDREASGALHLTREGGHTRRRIIHAGGDATGAEVQRALDHAAASLDIRRNHVALDLLIDGGAVAGVSVLSEDGPGAIYAPSVILATGGAGHLYRATTNPEGSTGDGVALAIWAGISVLSFAVSLGARRVPYLRRLF